MYVGLIFHSDINECIQGLDGCEHNCTNTNGSYYCTCINGYELETDNHTCIGNYVHTCTSYIWYRSIITSFLHAWCHAVFHMLLPKICRGIYISTRHDVTLPQVVFTHNVEFAHNGNVTFSRGVVVLTKLSK